jgi:uncharacterized membrane protein
MSSISIFGWVRPFGKNTIAAAAALPQNEAMYKKQRIEALSDGIFAIAMTLLVLDLKVPTTFPHGQVWAAIKPEWEQWISFALTFGLAARFWTLQHDVFQAVETVGRSALISTFAFLGLISILPYTTSLLGAHFSDPSVLTLYFIHEFAIAAVLALKLELCRAHGHIHNDANLLSLRVRLYGMCASLVACLFGVWLLPLRWLFAAPVGMGVLQRRVSAHLRRNEPKQQSLPE